MPRGFDRSGDPANDLSRNSIVRRIVSRFTDSEPPSAVAPVTGRTPPPRPMSGGVHPPRSRAYPQTNNVYGTVSERLANSPARVSPRVEASRSQAARVSDQVSRGGHLGKDPQDRSLSSWRSTDKGYRKP